MPRASMRWMAGQLRRAGFQPQLFGYGAVTEGLRGALPALRGRLAEPCHVLAHSLGGVMAVRALQRYPGLPVRRVVCLGSPLCGSAAAEGLSARPLGRRLLGRSARLLHRGCQPWTGAAEMGVLAGDSPLGFGQALGRFNGPSDGTVAVAETRLDGLADHLVLPLSHSGMLFSRRAAGQAVEFLRHGRFRHDAAGGGL
ncbi:alpha/beta hydrolase [Lysobacter sp. GX 14042]|nr:alpha/beta hydrolase [Lysobacter sp. GX 14042]MCE7031143.1 alpha/beta hydrolase [Lysobacter sp. GX 14042]